MVDGGEGSWAERREGVLSESKAHSQVNIERYNIDFDT